MDTSETLVSRETTIALGLPPAGDPLREGGNKRQKNGRGVKRNQDRLKIGSLNVNGINNEQKRKEVVVQFSESDLDVLGLQETHLVGEGTEEGNKLWEGLRGIACWSGLKEGYKGKKKEGVAILMSERMSKLVIECRSVNSRVCWAKCKIGVSKVIFVSAYAPVNSETLKGRKDINEFWQMLNGCVCKLQEEGKVVIMGDMNAKVGDERQGSIVGGWGVEGRNENGEQLIGMC